MKKLFTLTLLILISITVFGQRKPLKFHIMDSLEVAAYNKADRLMLAENGNISITGDTIAVIKMIMRNYNELQQKYLACQELLRFVPVGAGITKKNKKDYIKTISNYFNLMGTPERIELLKP